MGTSHPTPNGQKRGGEGLSPGGRCQIELDGRTPCCPAAVGEALRALKHTRWILAVQSPFY